jgi:hypothetical protein
LAFFLALAGLGLAVSPHQALAQRAARARISVAIAPPVAAAWVFDRVLAAATPGSRRPLPRTLPAGARLILSPVRRPSTSEPHPIRRVTLLYPAN